MKILVIDDDTTVSAMLKSFLETEGHQAHAVTDPMEIPAALKMSEWDLILCDMYLGPTTGSEVLKDVKKIRPATPLVILTAHGSLDLAIDTIREGAFDFLGKPVQFHMLRQILSRVDPAHRNLTEVAASSPAGIGPIIGRSPGMVDVYKCIARASLMDTSVLIEGESGTGKELVARALHANSSRASAPFIPVNCAAIPEALMESELFGHVKGAFTGAIGDKMGLFRLANGGTLFLDEIAELPPAMQSKLLRVLEDRQVRPVGADQSYPVDIRLVCASNRSLNRMVREKAFREDLFYRINGVGVRVPALRERLEDIEPLAAHYVADLSRKLEREIILTRPACDALKRHSWPGNVRELVRELERACAISPTGVLTEADFTSLGAGLASKPIELRSLEEVERVHILSVLKNVGGNKQRAAEILKVDRKTLHRKLVRYNAEAV